MPSQPSIDDGMTPYFYLPYGTTLYGHTGGVRRWIRVTDDETATVHTITMGNEVTDIVNGFGLQSYMTYLTFGYTPFIEVALSGMPTGVDVMHHANMLLTQACHRSYDSRIRTLMELARKKHGSLLTRNNELARELSDELAACLTLWEQLMDSGALHPTHCLNASDVPDGQPLGIRRMHWFEKKYADLTARQDSHDVIHLPYKVDEAQRAMFLGGYGVRY